MFLRNSKTRSARGAARSLVSPVAWILFFVAALGPASDGAAQYNSPAFDRESWTMPDQEDMETAYKDARWSAGPLRVQPWLGVRDASLVTIQDRNVDGTLEERDDFTVTAGAGLRAYARNSPKLVFAVHALPEYVWWQDEDDKSGLNGRYGAGLFGFYNRLKLETSVRRVEQQDLFSTEVQELTTVRRDIATVGVDVEALRGLHVFGAYRSTDIAAQEDDRVLFQSLDRTESSTSFGVRLESARGFEIGVGVRDSEIELEDAGRRLSADGSGVFLRAVYGDERFKGLVDIERLEREPTAGSLLVPLEEWVGAVRATWDSGRLFSLQIYQEQDLNYSVLGSVSHLLTRRTGVTTRLRSKRSSFDFTYATGEDELIGITTAGNRTDDVTELRAAVNIPVGDLALQIYGSSFDYDSDLEIFDREFSSFGVRVDLGALARRLSLGSAEGVW